MTAIRPELLWATLCVLGGGAGCRGEAPQVPKATTRDSAGVAIVESPAPLGGARLPWVVDTIPALDIGANQDDPHQHFAGTVVPVRLATRQIVVATSSSAELRFFDTAGTWLKSAGRKGQGPGEFESLGWFSLGLGDTLLTYDWGLRRLSLFAPNGTFVRFWLLNNPSPQRGATPLVGLPGGRILVSGSQFVMPGFPSGVTRDTAQLLIYDETGVPIDSFGPFPGSEALIEGDAKSVTVMDLPFGKDLAVGVSPTHDVIFVGSGDRPEVGAWTATGRLLRVVRWAETLVPVTEQDRMAYLDALKAEAAPGSEALRGRLEKMVAQASLPHRRPAFAKLLSGPQATLWIESYAARYESRATTYQVFDSTGQWLSTLVLPARFRATHIGEGFILGTWRDPDDVDHVQLYRLHRRKGL